MLIRLASAALEISLEHGQIDDYFGSRVDAAPIASMPLADDRHRFRGEGPVPISGRSNLWVYLAESSADVEQEIVTLVLILKRIRGSVKLEAAEPARVAGTSMVSAGDSFYPATGRLISIASETVPVLAKTRERATTQ